MNTPLTLGPYTLRPLSPGKWWLARLDGEGMETTTEKLQALLDTFWQQEF
jgi:hypothetical protein